MDCTNTYYVVVANTRVARIFSTSTSFLPQSTELIKELKNPENIDDDKFAQKIAGTLEEIRTENKSFDLFLIVPNHILESLTKHFNYHLEQLIFQPTIDKDIAENKISDIIIQIHNLLGKNKT